MCLQALAGDLVLHRAAFRCASRSAAPGTPGRQPPEQRAVQPAGASPPAAAAAGMELVAATLCPLLRGAALQESKVRISVENPLVHHLCVLPVHCNCTGRRCAHAASFVCPFKPAAGLTDYHCIDGAPAWVDANVSMCGTRTGASNQAAVPGCGLL